MEGVAAGAQQQKQIAAWWHIFDGMRNAGKAMVSPSGPECPGYVPSVAIYRLVRDEQ